MLSRITSNQAQVPYLRMLARIVLRAKKPFIIGVTGSVGKTTTTYLIAQVLSHPEIAPVVGIVGHAKENMNDYDGLPLTILRRGWFIRGSSLARLTRLAGLVVRTTQNLLSRSYPAILVLEMGTDEPGMLEKSMALARPNIGILTAIGPAHLEKLGTVEAVFQEKMAVLKAVSEDGLIITGDIPDYSDRIRQMVRAPVVVATGEGVELARNIARIVGQRFGIRDDALQSALNSARMPEARLDRLAVGSLTIVDDSYNANPMSMKYGLKTFAETIGSGRRRVAILGDMKELGSEEVRYHEEIGEHARQVSEVIVGVGQLAKVYNPDFWFEDTRQCAEAIGEIVSPGDAIYIKGSNKMELGSLVRHLEGHEWPPLGKPPEHDLARS